MNIDNAATAANPVPANRPARPKRRSGLLLGLLAAATCLCAHAYADPLPPCTGTSFNAQEAQDNCAISTQVGPSAGTSSTSATITYTNTSVTNSVNDYSTTLIGLVNGSQVYSMTFLVPFSDPSLTTAIATADGILAGDGASFGGPSLLSSTSVLQGSVVTPPLTYTCISAEATGSTYLTGTTITTTSTFGPATISTGDCNTDTYTAPPGQLDFNVNIDQQYTIPVETLTTNTYLDSQTYEIDGTTSSSPAPTPEPASATLLLSGLGAIGWLRRRRQTGKWTNRGDRKMTTATSPHSSLAPAGTHCFQRRPAHSNKRATRALVGLLAVALCLCAHAYADPLPPCTPAILPTQEAQDNCTISNPGGGFVVTSSTSATITYTNTAVTNTVNDYSTTLIGLVNGSQVYSMTFLVPFSDPSLTSAIATADGILSGDGASFGAPSLFSSTSTLQSSVITPPPTYTCISAEATGSTYLTGSTITSGSTIGPATISAGDCNTDTFIVLAGQTDVNLNTGQQFTIPVQTVTTNTYLDSQTYEIDGTTSSSPAPTPEPASATLLLSGLGSLAWLRRRQKI